MAVSTDKANMPRLWQMCQIDRLVAYRWNASGLLFCTSYLCKEESILQNKMFLARLWVFTEKICVTFQQNQFWIVRIWSLNARIDGSVHPRQIYISSALAFLQTNTSPAAAKSNKAFEHLFECTHWWENTTSVAARPFSVNLRSTCSLRGLNLLAHALAVERRSTASTRPMGQTARLNRQRGRGEEGGHCSLSPFLSFCLLPLRLNTREHTHTHTHIHINTHTHTSGHDDDPRGASVNWCETYLSHCLPQD